eukprot:5478523-Prymnesium_polylepis.1
MSLPSAAPLAPPIAALIASGARLEDSNAVLRRREAEKGRRSHEGNGGAVVVRWWCGGGVVVVRWWCGGGAVVVRWWC